MKKMKIIVFAVLSMLLAACGTKETVPLTGRTHTLSVSDEQVLSLSTQEYNKYMATAKKSTNAANTAMVQRVGTRLANAVESYLKNNGYASQLKNFKWEFNLVQDNQVNAFCMPGGKIVVYEGLLPYTQNETCLAIVLGHEIAHAVAKHSAEQMSKQYNQKLGTSILGTVLNSAVGNGVGDVASQIASTGFQFANLKYSRDDELEADHMGLVFAAMAGYDPQQAVGFWQRMSSGSQNTSDFLSDHPSDAKRIAAIKKEMPEALRYYNASQKATTTATSTKKSMTASKTSYSGKQTSTKKKGTSRKR